MNECKNTQQNQGNHEVCPELRTTDLIPQCDTVSMKAKKAESKSPWTKAPVANLIRYEPSCIYFVRAKVRGKRVRKSLETNVLSVAKQRLRAAPLRLIARLTTPNQSLFKLLRSE
jgi:hypothetical protein